MQIRLQEERAEIQREKERYAKIRAEFQPDGRKVIHKSAAV